MRRFLLLGFAEQETGSWDSCYIGDFATLADAMSQNVNSGWKDFHEIVDTESRKVVAVREWQPEGAKRWRDYITGAVL